MRVRVSVSPLLISVRVLSLRVIRKACVSPSWLMEPIKAPSWLCAVKCITAPLSEVTTASYRPSADLIISRVRPGPSYKPEKSVSAERSSVVVAIIRIRISRNRMAGLLPAPAACQCVWASIWPEAWAIQMNVSADSMCHGVDHKVDSYAVGVAGIFHRIAGQVHEFPGITEVCVIGHHHDETTAAIGDAINAGLLVIRLLPCWPTPAAVSAVRCLHDCIHVVEGVEDLVRQWDLFELPVRENFANFRLEI